MCTHIYTHACTQTRTRTRTHTHTYTHTCTQTHVDLLKFTVSVVLGPSQYVCIYPAFKLKHDSGRTSYQCTFSVGEMKGWTEGRKGGTEEGRREREKEKDKGSYIEG